MPSDVTIISQSTELQASGLALPFSLEPLVAVYDINQAERIYRLLISVYIPNTAGTPILDPNFNTIAEEDTDAGMLLVRQVLVTPDWSGSSAIGYSLWNMKIEYMVNSTAAQAQALRVQCQLGGAQEGNGEPGEEPGGPETPRGTVTTVKKTIEY